MEKTARQYHEVVNRCRELFLHKAADYGPSWTILRLPSVTDQILIKAERIRSLQETGVNKVGEDEAGEFVAIVNYCVIALILFSHRQTARERLNASMSRPDTLAKAYDQMIKLAFETMERKNHDYGEAWRKMRISSITDLILMKIQRLKQIEDNQGQVKVSEGVDANYVDMLNYAIFALIKMAEAQEA